MSEENKPEEEPAAPPTIEEVMVEASGMSVDDLKAAHAADVARLAELKAVEGKTLENVREQKYVSERIAVFKSAHDEIVGMEDVTPEDLLTAPEPKNEDEDEQAPTEPIVTDEDGNPIEPEGTAPITPDEILDDAGNPVPVPANGGGNAGAPNLSINEPPPELDPFEMQGPNGKIRSLDDLAAAFRGGMGSRSENYIASFNPYGDKTAGVLGGNAIENFRTIYGDDTRQMFKVQEGRRGGTAPAPLGGSSMTAALNCKGPAQVIQDIPFCFTGGRPLQDSGLISMFEAVNGQIQLYGCHELPTLEGILQEAADCEDCNDCPDLTCATHTCIEPLAPMEPSAFLSCMCIPESLRFSAPFVLERALEDFAYVTDVAWELRWLEQLRALSIIRTVDGAAKPEHGSWATIMRSLLTLKSRLALDARCTNGMADYTAFVPGGEALFCSSMMDRMSRIFGCECPGEDILDEFQKLGVNVVFGLDQDPLGAAAAAGFTSVWDDDAVNTPAPLEDPVNAGSVYLIPRDTFATASPLQVEMGIDDRDKCEVASGCMKMIRREWWFDTFKVGCRDSVVLDFTDLGVCGTGPDATPCS